MTGFGDYLRANGRRSISVFGDSVTAGASVPEEARWANRFASRFGLVLRNRGISGTVLQGSPDADGFPRANNGFGRYQADLLDNERSDAVAILYGTNDARHTGAPGNINRDGFLRDYRLLLSGLVAAGYAPTDICIGGPSYIPEAGFAVGEVEFTGQSRDGFQAYVSTIEALAREFGTHYAAVNQQMTASGGDALILPDRVHPNPRGHGVIAEAFAQATILD